MTNFDQVFDFVIDNEGSFSDNPLDSGGPTNFGITAQFLMDLNLWQYDHNGNGIIDADDMRLFSRFDAKNVYKRYIWDKYGYDSFDNLNIAKHVFDMAVNAGQAEAIILLQRAFNNISKTDHLKEDGQIGSKTFRAINGLQDTSMLANAYIKERFTYYNLVVKKHPKDRAFIKNWENRAEK